MHDFYRNVVADRTIAYKEWWSRPSVKAGRKALLSLFWLVVLLAAWAVLAGPLSATQPPFWAGLVIFYIAMWHHFPKVLVALGEWRYVKSGQKAKDEESLAASVKALNESYEALAEVRAQRLAYEANERWRAMRD